MSPEVIHANSAKDRLFLSDATRPNRRVRPFQGGGSRRATSSCDTRVRKCLGSNGRYAGTGYGSAVFLHTHTHT